MFLLNRVDIFFLLIVLLVGCAGEDKVSEEEEEPIPVHNDYLQNPEIYRSIWRDDFTTLDPASWTIGLKDQKTGDMVPAQGGQYLLNSNYAGYITEEDSYVSDGSLYLRNQKRAISGIDPAGEYEYTSGWVMSMHNHFFNGSDKGIYLEIRAKFPKGDKVWPAIWLIPEALVWPPEIDLWEYFGQFFEWGYDEMYMRYIYGHYTDSKDKSKKIANFDRDFNCEEWHTYGFQWSSEKMIWSIDGNVKNILTKGVEVSAANWPKQDMYVVMNNGVLSVVPDENTNWPNYLIIDYIELHEIKE
jgi:beta-glucanase (GH16 family)